MKINSPKEKVWEVIADIGGIQKWAPIVTHSATITPSNRGVGCERTCEIKDVGSIHEKVIEWNEENGYKYEISGIPGTPASSAVTNWVLRLEGEQTVVEVTADFQLSGTEQENKSFLEQTTQLYLVALNGLKDYVEKKMSNA